MICTTRILLFLARTIYDCGYDCSVTAFCSSAQLAGCAVAFDVPFSVLPVMGVIHSGSARIASALDDKFPVVLSMGVINFLGFSIPVWRLSRRSFPVF